MKMNVRALGLTLGLLWGACIFLVGLGQYCCEGYGQSVLDLAASIYPGFELVGSFGNLLIGTAYGFVDGLIGGALLAWLYNKLTPSQA